MNSDNTTQADELPDLPGIDIQAGMEITRNNVQLYRRLLLKFLDGQQSYIDQFSEARSQQDFASMAQISHSLKGVAGNLGVTSVYDTVIELEKACKAEAENTEELLNIVLDNLSAVCQSISALKVD